MKSQPSQKETISTPEYLAAALFLAIPIVEFLSTFSKTQPYYVNHLLWVHMGVMRTAAQACWLLAAACLLSPALSAGIADRFDSPSQQPLRRHFLPAVACLSFTLMALFLKFCQYRAFQLPLDSASATQMAFNTLHGRWLDIPLFGCNALGVHFAFVVAFFAPVLLIWSSTLPLLFIQTLSLASLGLAVYELIWMMTSSALFAFFGMLLCYAHPHWHTMLSASLENSLFAPALFIWAVVCWKSDRKPCAALLLALMLTTREQAPFTIAGLGIYIALKKGKLNSRETRLGIATVAASAVAWMIMMKIVRSFNSPMGTAYWHLYSHFGSTREEIIHFVLTHPFRALAKAVWPPYRIWPNTRAFLYMALAPLAAPLELIPYLLAGFPQMMMIDTGQHDLTAPQYPALAFGPLLLAVAYGLANIQRLQNAHVRKYAIVAILLVCGFGFKNSSGILLPNWFLDWFYSAPRIIEQIPPRASLWADDWLTTWVACRAQLKYLPLANDQSFSTGLFRPEYVLMKKKWVVLAKPEIRDRLLTFLKQEGYVKLIDRAPRGAPLTDPANLMPYAERNDLILLKNPKETPSDKPSPPLELPQPLDQRELLSYVKYLIEP